MAWIVLLLAGVLEIGWAVGLKYTEGFSRLWPSVATIGAMVVSLLLLGLALLVDQVTPISLSAMILGVLAGLFGAAWLVWHVRWASTPTGSKSSSLIWSACHRQPSAPPPWSRPVPATPTCGSVSTPCCEPTTRPAAPSCKDPGLMWGTRLMRLGLVKAGGP